MRIAYILSGLPFGGIENLTFDIARTFKANGKAEAFIINIPGTGEKLKEFEDAGLNVINLYHDTRSLKVYRLQTAFKLRAAIKKINPHIIHTMNFSAHYFARLAAVDLKIPVVTHIHNTKLERHRHRHFLNRLLSARTDLFISVSKAVYDMAEDSHNLFHKKHIILYNAIDLSRFKYRQRSLDTAKEINLISVGRFRIQKNFDGLLRAFARIHAGCPNVYLTLIGDGRERACLENIAKDMGIRHCVRFTGYQKDVAPYLDEAHIFVAPSLYEGLNNAHLEAVAMGLPSVISKNVPSKEIVKDCSLICDVDVDSIRKNIERLITDPALYRDLSKKAGQVRAVFDINDYCGRLLEIYANLIHSHKSGPLSICRGSKTPA